MKSSYFKPETKAVHGKEKPSKANRPVRLPIYQSATFEVENIEDQVKISGTDHFYTRYGNPTFTLCEAAIAALENAEAGMIFPSGMAAITTAVLSNVQAGDHIVAQLDLYGTTYKFLEQWLFKYGIETTFVPTNDLDATRRAVRPNTKILYLETPTNPTLKLVDLRTMAVLARELGLVSMVDSTFNTPINVRPIDLGIDVVLHSATKYLSGHADLIGGVVVGSAHFVKKLHGVRSVLGSVMDPHAAWLLHRGLRSLALRMERHNQNALDIAEFLQQHSQVLTVNYPFLQSHPQYALARDQMIGGGGLLSFEIKGSAKQAQQVVNALRLFTIAPSLGGLESLVTMPAMTSHVEMLPEERLSMGVSDQLIRLAIGIENVNDLINDLTQALQK